MKRLLAVTMAGVMLFGAACAQSGRGAAASGQTRGTQRTEPSTRQTAQSTPHTEQKPSGESLRLEDAERGEALVIGTRGEDPETQGSVESPRGDLLGGGDAQRLVLERLGNPDQVEWQTFERDDGDREDPQYEGELVCDGTHYEFEMNALTGEITEWEEEPVGEAQTQRTTWSAAHEPADTAPAERAFIGIERAREIALAKVDGATENDITEFEFDRNDGDRDGRPEYEITFIYDGVEYEAEIDAYTGEITEWDVDKDVSTHLTEPTDEYIGLARAREIALAKVDGATENDITEWEFDRNDRDGDGRPEYEITFIYEGVGYEAEIDAYTGEITEWDVEEDD